MPLPADGGPLCDAPRLRHALLPISPWFIPEHSGKYTIKEYADWREWTTPLDPTQTYSGKYGPLRNTALRLDGLLAVDGDIDDPATAAGVLTAVVETLGMPPSVRLRPGSPRFAALYRCTDAAAAYASLRGADGAVEIFAGNRHKLTTHGFHVHRDTGVRTRLYWDRPLTDLTREELPAVGLADVLGKLFPAIGPWLGEDAVSHVGGQTNTPSGDKRAHDLDELYDAAQFVPGDGGDWRVWNKIGMALYSGSGGDDLGLAAFIAWSQKTNPHAAGACATRWQKYADCPPIKLGAGTIFQLAYANGYRRTGDGILDAIGALSKRQRWAKASLKNFNPKEIP